MKLLIGWIYAKSMLFNNNIAKILKQNRTNFLVIKSLVKKCYSSLPFYYITIFLTIMIMKIRRLLYKRVTNHLANLKDGLGCSKFSFAFSK
jgi:hypothetical protein